MSLRILGTGSALPAMIRTNDDLATFLDTSDEWISSRTGIKQRHILGDETLLSVAVKAANNALENAGLLAEQLDYIICPTVGGDYITPSLACLVQKEIGASCPAMDVNGACSGFIYGLDVAAAMLASGRARHILLLAAEGITRLADWTDRSTCVLFGDGAGAVILDQGEDLLYIHVTSQGWAEPLNAPYPRSRYPGLPPKEAAPSYLYMDGQEIYKFAVNGISKNLEKAMDSVGLTPEEVDHVLLHQANVRIIDAARKRLGIPEERYAINIQNVANMSAATIPVLMDECSRAGRFAPGDILLMSGFGGGLTTGTAVLRWSRP